MSDDAAGCIKGVGCISGVVGLAGVCLCGGFALAIVFGVFGVLKNSDPFVDGMAKVNESAEAKQALGSPIEDGWTISGTIDLSGNSGVADISFPVSGPKGSGTLHVVGTKAAGKWTYTTMRLDVDGGDSIDLLEGAAEGPPADDLPAEAPPETPAEATAD